MDTWFKFIIMAWASFFAAALYFHEHSVLLPSHEHKCSEVCTDVKIPDLDLDFYLDELLRNLEPRYPHGLDERFKYDLPLPPKAIEPDFESGPRRAV